MIALLVAGLAVTQAYEVNPEVFAEGEISTVEFESHPEFSPDGRHLYFVRSSPLFTDEKIFVSHLEGSRWTRPVPALFSGRHRDADPFITADGKRFYFTSDRPARGKRDQSLDVWFMDRERGGHWGKPQRLGPEVNSEADERYPTLTRSGDLCFGSSRNGSLGGCDLWRSEWRRGKFQKAENLGEPLNTPGEEVEPFVSPDGRLLVFSAERPDGLGKLDLYVSRRLISAWAAPERLPAPVNTPGNELSPKLSRDAQWLYYSGMRRGALGEIFRVRAAALGLP